MGCIGLHFGGAQIGRAGYANHLQATLLGGCEGAHYKIGVHFKALAARYVGRQ